MSSPTTHRDLPRAPVPEELLQERLARLTLEQKIRLLTGADFWALHPEPAAGLRRLVVSDGPAGARGERWDERDPSANVPSPTALAASWDVARVERLGKLLAAECRRKGVDVLLAPTVNLHRSPYGGRHFEQFSEDPYLTGVMGAAYVRGLQGEGVGATVKHFVANDFETERFTADVRVGERTLRELYLAPFELIEQEARPWAVMAAYNSVNGTTMTEHSLLNEVLKGEWGFDGVVMSDWFAGRSTEAAARAGLDLVMPGPAGPWGEALVRAVEEGRVSRQAIDDKVLRILRLAARVGALEGIPPATAPARPWSQPEVAGELRSAATAGFVLVRNSPVDGAPVLPLQSGALRRMALLGPNAAVARTLGGGSATVFPLYTVSPLQGLRSALGSQVQVEHALGVLSSERLPAAPIDLLRLPDGSGPGLEVRFMGPDGSLLGKEQRASAALTWMGALGPGLAPSQVAAIEVHARLRAAEDGTYLVGAGGLGHFTLSVGGEALLDTQIQLPEGADPVEGMMRPPQQAASLHLGAGEEKELVLRYEAAPPEGGFGEADLGMTMFQLNLARSISEEEELERAVELAGQADVAVVVVGTTEEVESEGFDRDSLALPGRQDELVRRVAEANPRTVVVVNAGAPVLLPWAGQVPAVLLAWFPGQEFGNALADVLLGASEPGGRLPSSWPSDQEGMLSTRPVEGVVNYDESIHIGHRRFLREGVEPSFWFGHGLGYTTWEYVEAVPSTPSGESPTLRVRVRNAGERSGREVVQVYASRPRSQVERPVRWLVGYGAVEAGPGQEADVEVHLPRRQFAHWDVDAHGWALDAGEFDLAVGRSAGDLRLSSRIELQ